MLTHITIHKKNASSQKREFNQRYGTIRHMQAHKKNASSQTEPIPILAVRIESPVQTRDNTTPSPTFTEMLESCLEDEITPEEANNDIVDALLSLLDAQPSEQDNMETEYQTSQETKIQQYQ